MGCDACPVDFSGCPARLENPVVFETGPGVFKTRDEGVLFDRWGRVGRGIGELDITGPVETRVAVGFGFDWPFVAGRGSLKIDKRDPLESWPVGGFGLGWAVGVLITA